MGKGLDDVLVLVALFPDLDIGADGEGVEWNGAFLRPLGEGLGKQVQAGDEEQDALVFPGDFLGDFKAGEGLAGAAGHDELATVGGCEAVGDFSFGAGLVGAEFFLGFEGWSGAGLVFRPVNLASFEIIEVDFVNGRSLAVQGVFRVLAPVVGGGDDVGLSHAVVLGKALVLDGVKFLGAVGLGDEVDAGVFGGIAGGNIGEAGGFDQAHR